jgi:hypothetical protein
VTSRPPRLYLYALVSPGLDVARLGTGIADEPLQLVALGPLDAVVGEMEDRPSIAPAALGAHDEVLRHVGSVSDALLPLPFGALVSDASELRDGLTPRLPALAAALEATRGCDQMTLRVQAGEPFAGLESLRESLRPLVRREKLEEGGAPPLRATILHLVERTRVPEYRARVDELQASLEDVRLDVTGPWVPYAFTEL